MTLVYGLKQCRVAGQAPPDHLWWQLDGDRLFGVEVDDRGRVRRVVSGTRRVPLPDVHRDARTPGAPVELYDLTYYSLGESFPAGSPATVSEATTGEAVAEPASETVAESVSETVAQPASEPETELPEQPGTGFPAGTQMESPDEAETGPAVETAEPSDPLEEMLARRTDVGPAPRTPATVRPESVDYTDPDTLILPVCALLAETDPAFRLNSYTRANGHTLIARTGSQIRVSTHLHNLRPLFDALPPGYYLYEAWLEVVGVDNRIEAAVPGGAVSVGEDGCGWGMREFDGDDLDGSGYGIAAFNAVSVVARPRRGSADPGEGTVVLEGRVPRRRVVPLSRGEG